MTQRGKTFGPNRLAAVLATVVLACAASTSFAQNAPPGGNGGNAGGNQGALGGGGRGNRRDPAQMRQQMNDRMKELLGANDEEWKLLQPQIEKVQTLQRATSSRVRASLLYGNGNNGGGGGRFRGGQQPDNAPPSAVEEKSKELAAAIQSKDTKPDEYKAKLAAFREARNQAKADLGKAQESLREVVTVRQEAVLVELGLLD